jgi:hypothetical protein
MRTRVCRLSQSMLLSENLTGYSVFDRRERHCQPYCLCSQSARVSLKQRSDREANETARFFGGNEYECFCNTYWSLIWLSAIRLQACQLRERQLTCPVGQFRKTIRFRRNPSASGIVRIRESFFGELPSRRREFHFRKRSR